MSQPGPESILPAVSPELSLLAKNPKLQPVLQVLACFPTQANEIIREQHFARKAWQQFKKNTEGVIISTLPNQYGDPGTTLWKTGMVIDPLVAVLNTITSLRGERNPQETVRRDGLFKIIAALDSQTATAAQNLQNQMVLKLLEVMQVDDTVLALLQGFSKASDEADMLRQQIAEIDRKIKAFFIPYTATETERITQEFMAARLQAQKAGLELQAADMINKAMEIIDRAYPPKSIPPKQD